MLPLVAPVSELPPKEMRKHTLSCLSIAEIDASTVASRLNAAHGRVQVVLTAKIAGFSFIRMHMCIRSKLRIKDGLYLQGNSFLKALSSCNTLEKYFR